MSRQIGVIGASSFVGESVAALLREKGKGHTLFSRKKRVGYTNLDANGSAKIEDWICVAPIWTLPENFDILQRYGCTRLVALSSTSRYTKTDSSMESERRLAGHLIAGEEKTIRWAQQNDVLLSILQPTLIYGHGKDENIAVISGFVKKFRFFPLFGKGNGLRCPVHVDDVALASLLVLENTEEGQQCYIVSGGECLSYREMVERIFAGLRQRPLFLRCPLWLFGCAVFIINIVASRKKINKEMAIRMNCNQDFVCSKRLLEMGFSPRSFRPDNTEL